MASPKPSPVDAVQRLRTEIVETTAELARTVRAPVPLEEAEQHLVASVEQLGAGYDPSGLLADFAREAHPSFDILVGVLPAAHEDPRIRCAFLAAVFRDALLAAWLPRLRARYAHDPGLAEAIPLAERPARVRHLQDRLHTLEVAEEQAILAAAQQGCTVDRRADASPAVIFDPVVLEASPPAA
jgi:hypothetical protein